MIQTRRPPLISLNLNLFSTDERIMTNIDRLQSFYSKCFFQTTYSFSFIAGKIKNSKYVLVKKENL